MKCPKVNLLAGLASSSKSSERAMSELNLNLPDNTFTLYRNTEPWFDQRLREYYKNNVQLAEDLIKCVNQNPFS